MLIAGLWLSDSRAAWLSAGLSLVFAWLRRFKIKGWTYPGAAAIALLGLFFLYGYRGASADSRIFIWRISSGMISDAPVWGHGPGAFSGRYMLYQADYFREFPERAARDIGNNLHAFNEPLRWCIEYGLPGMLLLACIGFGVFRSGKNTPPVVIYGLGAWFIFSLFSYPAGVFPL
ncbi:MAG: O-antigen ligase family protein [Rikenellaceae bacterium]|nr:O-antigen ligase family protein [Rikenellaceae bacterium]